MDWQNTLSQNICEMHNIYVIIHKMNDISSLIYPLKILEKAIHYKNLSAASQHIGLSQPQLSRLIKQLEEELQIQLLDRTSKRDTHWRPLAKELCDLFLNHQTSFSKNLSAFLNNSEPKNIHIGTLEGMRSFALTIANRLFKHGLVNEVFLDVLDLSPLEKEFSEGSHDLIITMRDPGKRKFKYESVLGYQEHVLQGNKEGIPAFSSFEVTQLKNKNLLKSPKLISNSLLIREEWCLKHKGWSYLPKNLNESKKQSPVILLAQDYLSEKLWKIVLGK